MINRLGIAAVVMLAAACGGSATSDSETPSPESSTEATEPMPTLTEKVGVAKIEILQGTTAVLVDEGVAPKKQNAPVIANRPGYVRVHATRIDRKGRVPALAAELRVKVPGKEDVVLADRPKLIAEYDTNDLDTTWNFELGADLVTPETTLEVKLRDPATPDGEVIAYPGADAPPLALGAKTTATTLKVKFVPVKYNADQSGRTPVLDDRVLEGYRRALYKMYPTTTVEVSAREPVGHAIAAKANGDGWDEVLDLVMQVRRADRVADDVYYVGVFEPATSREKFCSEGGCVLGVAPMGGVMDVGLRVALILGYGSEGRNGTLAQELAHAMGRDHAPCGGAPYPDDNYPYANARIGVAGWDPIEKELISTSSRVFDFMSYCGPVWVSDYTFDGLYQRMVEVETAMKDGLGKKSTSLRSYNVDGQGNLRMGTEVDVAGEGGGDVVVRYEDASGREVGSARASFHRYDSIPGGVLLAPEPPAQARVVRVPSLAKSPLDLADPRARRALPAIRVTR